RLGSESMSPSRWSMRRASRSGVRLTPSRAASCTCEMGTLGSNSPRRIPSRRRLCTVLVDSSAGAPLAFPRLFGEAAFRVGMSSCLLRMLLPGQLGGDFDDEVLLATDRFAPAHLHQNVPRIDSEAPAGANGVQPEGSRHPGE